MSNVPNTVGDAKALIQLEKVHGYHVQTLGTSTMNLSSEYSGISQELVMHHSKDQQV